jgi:hypothetical protein
MGGLRRRPLQREIAKPPIVSALQSDGQEKLVCARDVSLAAAER